MIRYIILFFLSFSIYAEEVKWPSCIDDIKDYHPDPPKYIPYEPCHVVNIMAVCRTESQIQFLKKVQQTRLESLKHVASKPKIINRRAV